MPTSHPQAGTPRTTGRNTAAIVVVTTLLALLRFGHTTPDSVYYVTMTNYFRGLADRTELHPPFAFRWAVPWLASWFDGLAPATAIALISLGSTLLAYLCLARLLTRLLTETDQIRIGLLFLIVSFPTINYGGAVLTDSAGFLVLAAAACALVERRFYLLTAILALGIGVRETTLLMVPAAWIYLALERDRKNLGWTAALTLTTLTAALLYRGWFSDLPPYFWSPDWNRFADNMTRPISWATLLLTLGPVGALACISLPRWHAIPRHARHFIIATGLPGLALLGFSMVAAFMSGRFAWPLYLALIPLVAGSQTRRNPTADDSAAP